MNRFTLSYQGNILAEANICIRDGIRVKEIVCTTDLDEGSDNLGSGGTAEGFVYGREYEFKVASYQNDAEPSDEELKKIQWVYAYNNAKGVVIVGQKESSGDTFKLKIDDLEMLGQEITVYAYMEDKEVEGELTKFCHYRFRYFDRKIVVDQLENRAKDPWRIDQASSSLCGMASIYYVLAKKDASGYKKLGEELHKKGEYIYGDYNIKPHKKAFEMFDMDPKSSDYKTVNMPLADWIVLATTRSKESLMSKMVYKGIEHDSMDMLKGVNWPRMMQRMGKELIGYKHSESTGLSEFLIQQKKRPIGGKLYDKFSDSDLEHLQEIEDKFKEGKQILLMVDADVIKDEVSYSYSDIFNDSHWVVYEGGLNFLDKNNNMISDFENAKYISFKIYTWGYNPVSLKDEKGRRPSRNYKLLSPKRTISVESFKSNFYGYIEMF